jgi:hypothetical protein
MISAIKTIFGRIKDEIDKIGAQLYGARLSLRV